MWLIKYERVEARLRALTSVLGKGSKQLQGTATLPVAQNPTLTPDSSDGPLSRPGRCGQEANKRPTKIVTRVAVSADLLVTMTMIFRDFPQSVQHTTEHKTCRKINHCRKRPDVLRPVSSRVTIIFQFNSTLEK